jgi:hypothetical protein
MDANRRQWNQGHQKLHRSLSKNQREALDIFLTQHAMVHSQKMSRAGLWSFEDEVLTGLTEDQFRCIPPDHEHSIVWVLFHIARIEDITMNLLVAGMPQLFLRDDWRKKLNIDVAHSANSMDDWSVAVLSAQIDMDALRAYRLSVGRRTREIVRKLEPEDFRQKADPSHLRRVMDEGALLPDAIGILNYWSKRTIAGLLLMPPTRHNFLHLNEALRIKQKIQSLRPAPVADARGPKVSDRR